MGSWGTGAPGGRTQLGSLTKLVRVLSSIGQFSKSPHHLDRVAGIRRTEIKDARLGLLCGYVHTL
jgi:hypothetical protein